MLQNSHSILKVSTGVFRIITHLTEEIRKLKTPFKIG